MDQLLDGVAFKEGFEGIRDKFIINMFYQTGMRLELIGLKDKTLTLQSDFKSIG